MTKTLTLSISIVTYRSDLEIFCKTLAGLHRAVAAASETYPLSVTLFVVDNSVSEAWSRRLEEAVRRAFPQREAVRAEFIKSSSNSGYGRGNNVAIEKACSDYHLVLNPDVYVESDALCAAIAYMKDNRQVGLLSPAVYGSDGRRQYLCKRDPDPLVMFVRGFFPRVLRRLFRRRLDLFEMRDRDYDRVITDIPFPTGCFMFFRTSELKRIGGFDPRFFLYFEDADIGRMIRQISAVHYSPRVRIIHDWAGGVRRSWYLQWLATKSAFIYFSKWSGASSEAASGSELRESP